MGGVEESTLRLNSAQFQMKLSSGAELGNIGLVLISFLLLTSTEYKFFI